MDEARVTVRAVDRPVSIGKASRATGFSVNQLNRMANDGVVKVSTGRRVRIADVLASGVKPEPPSDDEELGRDGSTDLYSSRAKKERFLAGLKELQYHALSGRLVDADVARRRVFELGRMDRDAWMNWPNRVASLMAADLGVEAVKLVVILEKYVREHLAERAEAPTLDLGRDHRTEQ